MNCPRKFLAIGLLASLAGVGSAMPRAAQESPAGQDAGQGADQAPSLRRQDPQARIRTTVSLVVVPVTVKNGFREVW